MDKTFLRNSIRLAEVWMDEYAKYFYQRRNINDKGEFGDISVQISLRDELNCSPFKSYLQNVYPELVGSCNGISLVDLNIFTSVYSNRRRRIWRSEMKDFVLILI